MMPNYWLTMTNLANFEIDRKANFAFTGYKERVKKLCGRVEIGDKLVYYVTKTHRFGAICTVTSRLRIDRTPHWSEKDEVWPCRFDLKPDLILPGDRMLDVRPLVSSLSFITQKQKQAGKWGMSFRGSLKPLPQRDFEIIEREMRGIAGKEAAPPSLHETIKSQLRQIGETLGRVAQEEFRLPPYSYDVVWRETEGLSPTHVFEVQDKGDPDKALAKLQHARDVWRAKLCIVVTGEKDKQKVYSLLRPFGEGAYHRIGRHTLVLTPEEVNDIHEALLRHQDAMRHFNVE